MSTPHLISFDLCPYVQRAVITMLEKNVPFERTYIDLANKPDWFLQMSPLGRVPVLQVGNEVLFESAVIAEYLDETNAPRLHPEDPLTRAKHRAWIEFASAGLVSLWNFYTAADDKAFAAARADLDTKLDRLEAILQDGPFFAGAPFSLVDAAFGPFFRYFPVLESLGETGWFDSRPKVASWKDALLNRRSVQDAVQPGYADKLVAFIKGKGGVLGKRVA
ncbi:glutathione S-transferase [Andreprevotia lacus DSM 23236]|jgi:glutathione S-transferase|uniref:glutathione transferase n=1 Tax=Andreprevotia lacus DSM 23236 TaxID=1121001 RepID=A0A1W1XCD6_9NEIS|nr:glutathione S-transferase family protein [Andreprevotia lacus]SMC21181.1 glutathione S-transferase [Andreprevotia lacus DSM 23236]